MASSAFSGSAARVTGRPMTRIEAPAASAARGVATRCWSSAEANAGRMPGTTVKNSGPQAFRTSRRSVAEQTTPSRPESAARKARRAATSSTDPAKGSSASACSPMEVRSVTAIRRGRSPPRRAASAARDSAARIIISRPPEAWTLIIDAPVETAAAAAVSTGASMINVHASGGREMMMRAAESLAAEAARRGGERPRLIAVTLLTSIGEQALAELPFAGSVEEVAARLAFLAADSGLDGVVCSATDLLEVRKACGPEFLTVVPGIRPAFASADDQQRVATPRAALAAGASILVIGRPVTRAADPEKALDAILVDLGS